MLRASLPIFIFALGACAADSGDDVDGAAGELNGAAIFTETTATALKDQPCGPGTKQGCYTNYTVVADLDGDGNLDLVFANGGNHFVVGEAQPQAIYFGDGAGKFSDGAKAFPGLAPSIVRQMAVADFDGDGRLDVYMPAGYGTTEDQLFLQTGKRKFSKDGSRLPAQHSRAGGVHAGDIDNDGDMDLVIADWGDHPNPDDAKKPASAVTVRIFENDGQAHFRARGTVDVPGGTTATDVDLADVDGDFALDLVVTNRNGQSRLFFNDGKGQFKDVTSSRGFPRKQGPFTFNAELCDLDADGDLDLVFDGGSAERQGLATQLLVNDGKGKFTDASERIAGEPQSDDNQVKCADVDNDGDFDLVVASLSNPAEKLLRNDGKGKFKLVDGAFPDLGDPTLSLDFGDFDGDGKVDLVTAQGETPTKPFLNRVFKNSGGSADKRKPVFRAVEQPKASAGKETIVRFAVSDAHTSETGQHVTNVGVVVEAEGKKTTIPAQFIGGDLFRAVIPAHAAGKMKVTPQATDRAGNLGSGDTVEIKVGS